MISRVQGELTSVGEGRIEIACGSFCFELLVPACDVPGLDGLAGQEVEFFTLHYLESQGQGSSFLPRLIGFSSKEDRAFFELFTTVKGLGNRKSLRALQLPFPTVARAIADKDLDLLVSLPEIGKRTAETILAELHGKVDRFVELKPAPATADPAHPATGTGLFADAVAVLSQLGEPRLQARQLVERAAQADPGLETAEELVAAAFRLKES
jgi:Holliday junction DNA helicase RuvA